MDNFERVKALSKKIRAIFGVAKSIGLNRLGIRVENRRVGKGAEGNARKLSLILRHQALYNQLAQATASREDLVVTTNLTQEATGGQYHHHRATLQVQPLGSARS